MAVDSVSKFLYKKFSTEVDSECLNLYTDSVVL